MPGVATFARRGARDPIGPGSAVCATLARMLGRNARAARTTAPPAAFAAATGQQWIMEGSEMGGANCLAGQTRARRLAVPPETGGRMRDASRGARYASGTGCEAALRSAGTGGGVSTGGPALISASTARALSGAGVPLANCSERVDDFDAAGFGFRAWMVGSVVRH